MYAVLKALSAYLYYLFRPFVKWYLRKTTQLCEIQRICYGTEKGAQRAHEFDYSIRHSRNKAIQALVRQLDVFCNNRKFYGENGSQLVEFSSWTIIREKKVNTKVHKGLYDSLTVCFAQVFGYRQLFQEVEHIRKEPFNTEYYKHEEKLYALWNHLMPDVALASRISKQWSTIGFQGDDPKTDFRGMGILGLENLLFFASQYTGTAKHVLSHSHHPQYGYSFAIVGINLTSMAYEFLDKGILKTHMYNVVQGRPSMKHFNQVYVYLFYEFDKFWLSERPKNIMEFTRIKDLFRTKIMNILSNPRGVLRLNFAIETI